MAQEKPKPPPPPTLTRLAGPSLIETIDGPMEIVKLVGKVMPVRSLVVKISDVNGGGSVAGAFASEANGDKF